MLFIYLAFALKNVVAPQSRDCGNMDEDVRKLASVCGRRLVADPYDLDALFTKGLILARLGNIEGAVAILNGVLSRNPDYPGGWRVLGKLYQMLGRSDRWKECLAKSSFYVE